MKNLQTGSGLRLRVILGLTTFLLLVVAASLFQLSILKRTESNYQVLASLSKLEMATADLLVTATRYDSIAPRDYGAYNRDVELFLPSLADQYQHFDSSLTQVEADFEQHLGMVVPAYLEFLVDQTRERQLGEQLAEVDRKWVEFQSGFSEQLGADPAEPRLEWGAEFLIEKMPELSAASVAMIGNYRDFLAEQKATAMIILKVFLISLGSLAAVGLVWFYLRVIRRIGRVVKACMHVAEGEFGYTLAIDGNDELSVLARAFNILSSRSKLVVSMLTDLQRAHSIEHGLGLIVQSSGTYLPVAWIGLLEADSSTQSTALKHAVPEKSITGWNERHLNPDEPFADALSEAIISRQPLIINNLRERALEPGEEFLKRLVRATQMEALAALPLSSGEGWEGYLLLASKRAKYEPDHIELLKNLAPSISLSFQRLA